MPLEKKALKVGVWSLSPFLLGTIRDPLGQWFGLPITQEEMLNKLLSPVSPGGQDLWMNAALYGIAFLLLTCMSVTIFVNQFISYYRWRYFVLIIGPYSIALLLFWSLKEIGIILAFNTLDFLKTYILKKVKLRRGKPKIL
ncbi:hypothetical protein JYT87_02800 [Nitrospira defluvii]|nr:hypothetical protein [Nitrospira defluvii]